jgi:transposase, IS5 family
VENRIVSISQPHVRPIVRGKAGTNVDFGVKLVVSVEDGKAYLEKFFWDNDAEAIKRDYERHGFYPAPVHVA